MFHLLWKLIPQVLQSIISLKKEIKKKEIEVILVSAIWGIMIKATKCHATLINVAYL